MHILILTFCLKTSSKQKEQPMLKISYIREGFGPQLVPLSACTCTELRSATRILLRERLKNEKNCDVILMAYFRWRNLYDVM